MLMVCATEMRFFGGGNRSSVAYNGTQAGSPVWEVVRDPGYVLSETASLPALKSLPKSRLILCHSLFLPHRTCGWTGVVRGMSQFICISAYLGSAFLFQTGSQGLNI